MMKFFKGQNKKIFLLKILKNRHQSWIGHIIRHNVFVVNILEGAISGENAVEDLHCNK